MKELPLLTAAGYAFYRTTLFFTYEPRKENKAFCDFSFRITAYFTVERQRIKAGKYAKKTRRKNTGERKAKKGEIIVLT